MNRIPCPRLAAAAAAVILAAVAAAPAARAGGPTRAEARSAVQLAELVRLSAAEARLRDDPIRFQQTVIGGAATVGVQGCLGGAVQALLNGGNRGQARRACTGGALQGAAAGAADGYRVHLQEEANRRQLGALQVAANDMRQDNQRLQAFLDSSSQVLRDGQARLAALNGDVANRRLSLADAEQARQRERQNIQAMEQSLAEAKKTRSQYVNAAAQLGPQGVERRPLDAELTRMNAQIAQLEKNVLEYQRALGVSRA